MTNGQAEILDKALEKLGKGQEMGLELPLQVHDGAIELMVAAAAIVQALPALPAPNPEQARADRADFLARVEQLPTPIAPAKSPGFLARLSQFLPAGAKTGAGSRPLVPAIARAVLILVAALFVSLGGTAVLAASSLPTAPIYPVKLLVEEARLSFSDSLSGEAALHLAFAGERAAEMAHLTALNRETEKAQLDNYRAHWRRAMQLAGQMPDEELQSLLSRVQSAAGEQEALLVQAQSGAGPQTQEELRQAVDSLAQVQTAVQIGTQNRERFRLLMQQLPDDWPGESFGFGPGPGDCEEDCEDAGSYSPAPGYSPGEIDQPGRDKPGDGSAGRGEPRQSAPGNVGSENEAPAGSHPGSQAPGPGITEKESPADVDPGDSELENHNPGQVIPGHQDPGNEDPGNSGPGNGGPGGERPENEPPGSDNGGNEGTGNDNPGAGDPGTAGSGQENSGETNPGNDDSGSQNPGGEEPGKDSPGQDDPGQDDPGQDDPAKGDPGNEGPGEGDPGSGNPDQSDPGEGDPGSGDPGGDGPGSTDPGGKR